MAKESGKENCRKHHYNKKMKSIVIGNGCWNSSKKVNNVGSSNGVEEPEDADYANLPSLSDEIVQQIFARVPRTEYWKLCFLNKCYSNLVKSGELYKIRKEIGVEEASVFMLVIGESNWWTFDRHFKYFRRLPCLPFDPVFTDGDKESICAGTQLLVSGKEIAGDVIWRYELTKNEWFRGPSMISPRCLFGSANCGDIAIVAGGMAMSRGIGIQVLDVLDSAEQYNSKNQSWEPLPKMHKRRKLSSGCYMDDKFYVIGGQDDKGNALTCGECFDARRDTWELIPNMLEDSPVNASRSPPLVAVVSNELYSLDPFSNKLKVYLKKSNSWRVLGEVPVRADHSRGWGIAFKSLRDELLVIGGASNTCSGRGMTVCTCCPDPDSSVLNWNFLETGCNEISHFVLNCSVMVV